jgi:hypothetical protein
VRFQCCERNYAVLSGDIHTVLSVDIYAVLSDNPCSMRRAKSPRLRVLSEAIYGENGGVGEGVEAMHAAQPDVAVTSSTWSALTMLALAMTSAATRGNIFTPNETKLSHRWRKRASFLS